MNNHAEKSFLQEDLGHILRLALGGQIDDLRLFLARMVRKYRSSLPVLADSINTQLKTMPAQRSVLRKGSLSADSLANLPLDEDSSHSLLKEVFDSREAPTPIFDKVLQNKLDQLILERCSLAKLQQKGLSPITSAIFTGPPGVGKTMAARWIASQLKLPLYILDLTTVMSSLLGKTGANLRSVLDFAKSRECVLFLDEIDSIAKSRNDSTDIGELKRLVTIILQEIENWPEKSLLLAATNFPDLIDSAVWRRFNTVIDFHFPGQDEIEKAIIFYSDDDINLIKKWDPILKISFLGKSYSCIESFVKKMRKSYTIYPEYVNDIIKEIIRLNENYSKEQRKQIIKSLHLNKVSNRTISDLIGMHRDTIAKYIKEIGNEQN